MSQDPTRVPRANRLENETSPYLLQHAGNPVDWYPWGEEALELARRDDKPIFLSIGYSACHWCHVMERESFENPKVAELMNRHFVNVKVDREERPDLDEIYMKAVLTLTGSGGWPMSVFLTPELEPFYGGTYFPPSGAHGRPGFAQVLDGIAQGWERDRGRAVELGRRLAKEIAAEGSVDARAELDPATLDRSLEMLRRSFDPVWGGFGDAPKFPHSLDIRLCLRHYARTGRVEDLALATISLEKMALGGIHDQLGGGFHRYSTDEQWVVPHFEKMLYDNALLIPAYLEASLVTGEPLFEEVARGACEWALREMVTAEGGFASSQDADSEGEEGLTFTWTPDELAAVLGRERGYQAQAWFGVEDGGNFEHGRSALWRKRTAAEVAAELGVEADELERTMACARVELLAAREKRVQPGTDDKVLTAWNGLFVSALAMAYQVLDEPRYLEAARRATRYVLGSMRRADGKLYATARAGRAHIDAGLDDYVFLIQALIDLYESDFDPTWIERAVELAAIVEEDFLDTEKGGYFTTASGRRGLIARLKNPHDGALPAGNGVHASNLLRLAELTGRSDLAQASQRTIVALGQLVNRYPAAFGQLLLAVDFLQAGPREIVIAGEPTDAEVRAMLTALRRTFLPQRVVALADHRADPTLLAVLEGRTQTEAPKTYICQNYACQAPIESAAALTRELASLGGLQT